MNQESKKKEVKRLINRLYSQIDLVRITADKRTRSEIIHDEVIPVIEDLEELIMKTLDETESEN